VAAFTGVQLVSEAVGRRADLHVRVAVMWRHILPSIAHPATIARLRPEGATDPSAAIAPQDTEETAEPAETGIHAGTA
jgi:hypothetical protein